MSSWGTAREKKKDAPLSKETAALLADVMGQRGTSLRAQQDITDSLRRGDPSWVDTMNSGTAQFKKAGSKPQSKVKVPTYSTTGPLASFLNPAMPPATFSGKRMHNQMPAPERDMYAGHGPGPDRDKEKERLAIVMEVGAKEAQAMDDRMKKMKKDALEAASKGGASRREVDLKEAKIDTIIEEITERREFLEAMRGQGRGEQYEGQIRGEISTRMAELKALGQDVKVGRPAADSLGPKPLSMLGERLGHHQ